MKNTSAPRKKADERLRVKSPPLHPVPKGEEEGEAESEHSSSDREPDDGFIGFYSPVKEEK
jgi:hypothetical protein